MGKLKFSICIDCKKKIGRHNGGRIRTRVAVSLDGKGVHKDKCLVCYQK